MAVRIEKEENGKQAIVIDGFEAGISESPYSGIPSLKNLNINYLKGATYVNYKRQAVTLSAGGGITMGKPKYFTQSPGASPTYYILDDKGQVWSGSSSTFTHISGNHTASSGLGNGIAYWKDYLFVFGTNYIDVCGNGTGTGGINSSNWISINGSGYYAKNLTSVSMTAGTTAGQTSLTLSSTWAYVSGSYQIVIGGSGQIVSGTFTKGSATVPFTPAINTANATTTIDINIIPSNTNSPEHMALVGTDDVLYFCNGNTIGAISSPAGQVFNPSSFPTMNINYSALALPTTEISTWLVELRQQLLVAGYNYIYPWDRLSTSYNIPLPINEQPTKMINILNTIYIFAGQKGNVYLTNGYQISLYKKIPDSFLGVIDPTWVIGGVMFHRNKLCFGGLGFNTSGTNTNISGIFSINLSDESINFESQNSYGSSATSSADATNVLIDKTNSYATGLYAGSTVDSYLSAYYNNSAGGMNYNDSTLWDNYEPAIETDLIPIGTFLTKKTFETVEYKLDKPLANGDSIRLSYRTQFSGSYTLVGESQVTGGAGITTATSNTATQVLSDVFNSNIDNAQWVQLKVEFKCASSSSYIRLREIRIR